MGLKRRPRLFIRLLEGALLLVVLALAAAIVIPNLMVRPSRTAHGVGAIESIRAAIAAYAADSTGNTFPVAIDDWGALTVLVNSNGGALKHTEKEQGVSLRGYSSIDHDQDGIFENYTMSFRITGIPAQSTGSLVLVSPSGIDKDKLRR
ncbi:hypothetical protein [Candidatus Entotheonella palauensis]|uniref:Type II secretion system protein GspG C-terminal domain-containing protein n=1 Tax=Candidatus Entotheonella gemina TaxID=1429439 RepID=W4M5M0_9BACT|nr:hypothetical protein [Candidatus Entotheonella palauensis]ETX05473.1 MAG: hypothetical protein ETSY2_22755 [Candidatus Entotheonella gemina]